MTEHSQTATTGQPSAPAAGGTGPGIGTAPPSPGGTAVQPTSMPNARPRPRRYSDMLVQMIRGELAEIEITDPNDAGRAISSAQVAAAHRTLAELILAECDLLVGQRVMPRLINLITQVTTMDTQLKTMQIALHHQVSLVGQSAAARERLRRDTKFWSWVKCQPDHVRVLVGSGNPHDVYLVMKLYMIELGLDSAMADRIARAAGECAR
jgi:hypothetical protein